MKFKNILLLIPVVLLFAISCQNKVKEADSKNLLKRKWMLVEYKNIDKAKFVELKSYLDLRHQEKSSYMYSSNIGCNIFNGEFKTLPNNKIKFYDGMVTQMFCEGLMDLESNYFNDLISMTNYKIEGHFLTLSNNQSQMKFVAEDWD